LTDAIKYSDISGSSELLIIHFKWYGIIAQSAALFASTLVHYTHTLHTCCGWSGTSWAPWYVHFPPISSAGERPV